jgi:tetratricopeptide (TPR) repeat protein
MRITRIAPLVVAACGASAPSPSSSVELPRQLPSPVASVSIALPQKYDPPPALSEHAWKPPTPKDPPDVGQARQYFMHGVKAYDAGAFAQAEMDFETAYSYSPHDAVLLNIATALEHIGHTPEALDVYERYANTHPANESVIRKKIEALRKR